MVTGARKRDAAETRENIMEVATAEFSDKGLAGARIDQIAEKTATSKRMIYYYFDSKEELYRAVLRRAYERIREQEAQEHFEMMEPFEALSAMIEHNFEYHFRHEHFVRLVMNENLHHGEYIATIPELKSRNLSVIEQLNAILAKGEEKGVFRPGIDPVELHAMISSLSFYNVSNRHTFLHNFGVDFAAPAVRARRLRQITQCVTGWVSKGPA